MTGRFVGSVLVGLTISAVLFVPLLVWQYRRFGRFDGLRMLWTTAGFVHATSLIAFTVFPLPEFTAGYCAAHRTGPLLDPLRFPRELVELARTEGLIAAATDWVLWEVALNVVLFIPFGLILRRVLEWPRRAVLTAAVATSLLIELTQYTGNWGLAPCPYRYADVTDLLTNSTGALVGIWLEKVTPRLLSTKAHLVARKDLARPVTRGQRLLGMVLDACYLALAATIGGTSGAVVHFFAHAGPGQALHPDQMLSMQRSILFGAWLCSLIVVVLPALVSTGGSLGQRTVYLAPVPRRGRRGRVVLRALLGQGVVITALFSGLPATPLSLLWAAAALASVLATPRGLSGVLAGCRMRDSREQLPGSRPRA